MKNNVDDISSLTLMGQKFELGEKVFSLDYLYLQTQKGEHDV